MEKGFRKKHMLKDKKITISELTNGYDDAGFPEEVEREVAKNIWAYYRQTSGKEFFEAAKVNTKIDAVFIINWRNDIDMTMKIKFRNETYEILRIDDFEGYKKELSIYAYKVS